LPLSAEDEEIIDSEHSGEVSCELCGDLGDWLYAGR
jgi:hypothetical protein